MTVPRALIRHLLANRNGAAAAELAMLLPLMMKLPLPMGVVMSGKNARVDPVPLTGMPWPSHPPVFDQA